MRYGYVYDNLNQLVRVNDAVSQKTVVYTYDNAGNILNKTEYPFTTAETLGSANNVINYTYDSTWGDKLTAYGNKAITYDNIGNPLTIGDKSFTWSGRQLDTYTEGNKSIEFHYDENGLRHRKIVKENGVATEQYDYVWSDGKLITQTYTSNGTSNSAKFIYSDAGEVVGFILNDTNIYLYTKNLQGDVTSIVNESGNTILNYTYDAWGNVSFSATSMQNMMLAYTLAYVSPFTYRGYCYDYDIELYYLQSRYYSAEIGRFINTDDTNIAIQTVGRPLGNNLFAYCENNTVNNVDFDGYISFSQAMSKIKSYISRLSSSIYNYVKGLVIYNRNTRILSIDTGLIATVIDAAVAAIVRAVIYSGVKQSIKFLLKNKTVRNKYINSLFNFFVNERTGRVLLWIIVRIGFSKAGKPSALSSAFCGLMNGYISNIITRKSLFLTRSSTIISALSSVGGLIALVIDQFDGEWDGRLRVRI